MKTETNIEDFTYRFENHYLMNVPEVSEQQLSKHAQPRR